MKELVLVLVMVASVAVNTVGQSVAGPKGWKEHPATKGRVYKKGTSVIVVGEWNSLDNLSLREYMKQEEKTVPQNVVFRSSLGVKPERIKGAFSVARKVTMNGKPGNSVLYGYLGESGFARVMSATVESKRFLDLLAAGRYFEQLCEAQSKHVDENVRTSPGDQPNRRDLAEENLKIPAANRPTGANTVLRKRWKGFPAQLVFEAKMMMSFPTGYSTDYAEWNLLTQQATPDNIGQIEDCELIESKQVDAESSKKSDSIRGFSSGATIALRFGRNSGSGVTFGDDFGSQLSRGVVEMSKDGRIEIGEVNAAVIAAGGNGVGGGNRRSVKGRYYLNGYTITIETDDGELFHTFIGVSSDSDSNEDDHLFLAGKHYWSDAD